LRRLLLDESGGPLVEYGLIVSLVALASIAALATIGTASNTSLTNTQTGLVSSAETYPVINP
jgi:Flp pilus assembly pilin Flp